MRRLSLLPAIMATCGALPFALSADDTITTAAAEEAFTLEPRLEAVISGSEKPSKAKLPDDARELRKAVIRPMASVPGRMNVRRRIIIDKPRCRGLMVTALGDTLLSVDVCASKNRGQKHKKDDCRTPEGTFPLYGVYNSTDWTYEDTDDKCYGPWFLSLKTPRYWGVGVHGTNNPSSVPGRRSHGCVRMHSDNIIRFKQLVQKDIRVTVLPDPEADDQQ